MMEEKVAGFDTKKFKSEKYGVRKEMVPVPELSRFFQDGEPAEWEVKGLDGFEYLRVKEAADRNQKAGGNGGRAGSSPENQLRAVREALGFLDGHPQEAAFQIELVMAGSVCPTCDLELAKKICKVSLPVLSRIAHKINDLTGMGLEPGKLKGSTPIQASEPA